MIKKIKIKNIFVGDDQPVFVIAEAGVNHNGSLKTALKLIDAAARAGADAVKFQTFRAEDVVTGSGKMADYQKRNTGKDESQMAMLKKLELPDSFYRPIMDYCQKKKIIFLSTPHGGFNSVDQLEDLKIPAFKFGSGDLTNLPVLDYAARLGKPMILSTGMATLAEVRTAVDVIRRTGNHQIIVLHCATNYPCPVHEVNLSAIMTMKQELPALVGYSDHTLGIQVPLMALALGACLIEKHFTLDRNLPGPDHQASLTPDELKAMIEAIRQVPVILGSKIKRPTASERELMNLVRKSVVTLKSIKRGEKFTKENIGIKRPGTGLPPAYYFDMISKTCRRDLPAGALIKLTDYEQ